jgi:hypothetical protein
MAECIGFLAAWTAISFNSSYTAIYWKNICDVTDTFETNSIFCSELVRSNQKHMRILNETLNLAQIYIKLISMSKIIVPIFFIFPTFAQHLMTSDEELLQAAETVDGFAEYFIFVIWLPPVLKQEFIIRVIYGLQCICFWEFGLFSSATAPFYTVLLLYTGTQFKLISSLIREMDEVMFNVENPGNILHEVSEQQDTTDTTTISTERILSSKMQQNFLQEDDTNRQSKIIHDLSWPEIKSTTKNNPEIDNLVECITLHQARIK